MSNVHILSGDGDNVQGGRRGWIFFDIEVGGGGGRPDRDGLDCYSQGIHNLANTPIEMVETTYPLRFRRYELLADTGGAGKHRGGLGVRRDIEFLDESGTLNTQFDKFKVAPFGLFGGGPGATGRLRLNPDRADAVELPSKTINRTLRRGDVVSMSTQGGGGYGPPAERAREAVERDLREGKLTPESARREYGWEGAAR
jgi:N-methylhydantoinase B